MHELGGALRRAGFDGPPELVRGPVVVVGYVMHDHLGRDVDDIRSRNPNIAGRGAVPAQLAGVHPTEGQRLKGRCDVALENLDEDAGDRSVREWVVAR